MEQALKDPGAFLRSAMEAAARKDPPARSSDKVFPFAQAFAEKESAAREDAPAQVGRGRDWSSAIQLIEEASEAIRINEDRVHDLEEQLADLMRHAEEEVERLNLQIAAADEKLTVMMAAARAAEARAVEAETWLARVHDAVVKSFKRDHQEG